MDTGPTIALVSCAEADLPAELATQVEALEAAAWPGTGDSHGHDPALRPWSMLLVQDGRVLSALTILSKRITHQGRPYAASGLSSVVTDAGARGHGHGRHLVEAARDTIARSGADLGLFTCDRPLRPFYERAGWQELPGAVLVGGTREEPFPSDQFDKAVMACFFSDAARRHAAAFVGSRIELHPGTIDRLW